MKKMHGNSIPHNSNSRMWITYKQMRFFSVQN